MKMSRLTRDGTAEPVSRDQILRRERAQGSMNFPCSADHDQDWQTYPLDPYSFYICDHTYKTIARRTRVEHRSDVFVRLYHHSSFKPESDVQLCQCMPVLRCIDLFTHPEKARTLETLGFDLPCDVKEAKSLLRRHHRFRAYTVAYLPLISSWIWQK